MIPPLIRPQKRNPLVKTREPLLPPLARSRAALGLTAAAAQGRFELQVCALCEAVQYPPREVCQRCLSEDLRWREQSGSGELVATTVVHLSQDPYFRERTPWSLGLVRLDAGCTAVAHLHAACGMPPCRVRVGACLDRSGQGVLVAFPTEEVANMADDRQLREMTCDPRFRKVLVTDAKTPVGQAFVRAVVEAGADLVWAGCAEPWKQSAGLNALRELPRVTVFPLDVTDEASVKRAAAEMGGKVDILVNTAEVHRTEGIASRGGTDVARLEMDVNYLGLLRLAQEFGPVLRARGADGQSNAVAWVNLLSIYALANFPPHGTFSASKAAALSLSQCMRAEMRAGGIRVINLFPGPIDDEWNQTLPPPKLAPEALAKVLIKALREGVEDVYPGDIAQEWHAKWRENPKVLELELNR
jgi:NAD(P)-dependent dehydrogenase (short-subunit alcohol dehydrogenase family)/uncharacterized OB-fold protein